MGKDAKLVEEKRSRKLTESPKDTKPLFRPKFIKKKQKRV
jgi:hypothetical protein